MTPELQTSEVPPPPDSPDYLRLFIALQVPSVVQRALQQVQETLRDQWPHSAIRWGDAEQIHLTLRFLGDVRADRLDELSGVLRDLCAPFSPVRLRASALGFFPPKRTPRVIWAGVQDLGGGLGPLKTALDTATSDFTAEVPEAVFSPHLTLGRVKLMKPRDAQSLAQTVQHFAQCEFGVWTVDHVELMRSELSSDGPAHTCVGRFPLASPAVEQPAPS